MTEESELHHAIGALTADMLSSQRQRQTLFDMMGDISRNVSLIREDQRVAIAVATLLKADVDEMGKRVKSLEVIKNRFIGVGLALTVASGAAWDAVKGFMKQ
ncbi:MAG: hypothetical protein ABL951_02560 [Alphaproteobacteria bacterium]